MSINLKIVKGKLAQKAKKEDSDFYSEYGGKKYYYKEYGKIDGKSHGITSKIYKISEGFEYEGKTIDMLSVSMKDENGNYVNLQVPPKSRYYASLLGKLVGADLSKPITIKPYDFVTKDLKELTGVTIIQDGEKLENMLYKDKKYPRLSDDKKWSDLSMKEKKQYRRDKESLLDEYIEKLIEKWNQEYERRGEEYSANNSAESRVEETNAPEKKEDVVNMDEDVDDLPF
jgi:hypothetical protein